MKLIDEEKISLDDRVEQYLAEEWITDDIRFEKITIRQLISHTSGFSPSFEMGVDKNIYFEPGNHFSYSGVGYIYLQQIIEQVTGESFEVVAQQYVFIPLKMKGSTFASLPTRFKQSGFMGCDKSIWENKLNTELKSVFVRVK